MCVLTGGGSGIGLATAVALARAGARVALVARTAASTRRALGEIETHVPDARAFGFDCDLSSQRRVRELAKQLGDRFPRIDVLVHDAAAVYGQRELSEDGVEMQLAINHLAPFLLTALLRERLAAAPASRIVTVTSRAHARATLDLEDLNLERGYSAFRAYDRSKLANVLFTYELARRLEGSSTTANCMQPGLVRTGIGDKHTGTPSRWLWWAMTRLARSPERAAAELSDLALSPQWEGVSGRYFSAGRPARSSRASRDEDLARELWRRSEALVGLAED